jgi:DNA invertase Pin-like site-specific DNA recombinase
MSRSFGYCRVSSADQDCALQRDALIRHGVDDRDIYRETASGARRDRTELRKVLDQLRPSDSLVIWRLDRLARSQLHLLQVLEEIETKGAKLISLMDNISGDSATTKLLLGILGVLGEFERNLLIERTKAGIATRRNRPEVRFGRPRKLTPALVKQVALAHDSPDVTIADVCRSLQISKSTYYNALRQVQVDQ